MSSSSEKEDGVVEKLMEEGGKPLGNASDKYDELKELEVNEQHGVETAYAGMGKEELMKYANSPFWVRLRWLLFLAFWLSWFAMMFSALFIIFMTPKCFPSSKLQWYQKSPVYVVDTTSLLGDDLDKKIEYITKLGVQNVVLTSVFKRNDGEIIDIIKSNETLANGIVIKDFIKKLKDKDMKVMLKVVPNYSSTSNIFFDRSILNEPTYKDYYIWNPGFSVGDKHFPINNWLNLTGGPAWTWNEKRNEFYLHQFSENEPDFNFRNKYVVDYFETMFKFWLNAGIDGLYLDEVQYLFVDKDLKNHTDISSQDENTKYKTFSDKITSNLPETYDLISRWGNLIRNNSGILIASDLNPQDVTNVDMVHSPILLPSDFTGEQLLNVISSKKNTPRSWSTWEWVCTNKSNCWENDMLDAFSILGSLLPGTPFVTADPKLFENNHIPNVTLIQSTLKELRSMPTVEFGSLNAKLLNNDTVFVFDRVMSGSENLLFAWNLSKNITVLDLSSFDETPNEVKLSLCTPTACSILPTLNSKVDSTKLSLAAESAVVLTF